jgi:dTDP-4-amino-4,6-dideoxygalactose transaminase
VQLDAECNRDQILGTLRREGIEAQIGANAIHREPVFRAAKITGNLKHAECLADQLLALPLHHKLAESDQELVANRLMELAR